MLKSKMAGSKSISIFVHHFNLGTLILTLFARFFALRHDSKMGMEQCPPPHVYDTLLNYFVYVEASIVFNLFLKFERKKFYVLTFCSYKKGVCQWRLVPI